MVSLKHVPHSVETTSSDGLEELSVLPKNGLSITANNKRTVKNLLNTRGARVNEQLTGISVNQLRGIAEEIDINVTKEINRFELQKLITWRLEWLGMQPARKAGAAKPWFTPVDEKIIKNANTMQLGHLKPDCSKQPVSDTKSALCLLKQELKALRAENEDLKSGLQKS